MYSIRLMPALPFATVLTLGIVAGYFVCTIPLWLVLIMALLTLVGGAFLLDKPSLRPYPFALSTFLVGMALMMNAKDNLNVAMPQGYSELKGIIVDTPKETARFYVSSFYVQQGCLNGKKLRLYVDKKAGVGKVLGCTYRVRGRLAAFTNFNNAGNFNYKRWSESHSYVAQMFVRQSDIEVEENTIDELPFKERIQLKSKMLRERIVDLFIAEGISGEQLAVMSAMAFGEKSRLSQSTRDIYAKTGVAHLLALSGLHLGILFALLSMVFVSKRRPVYGKIVVISSIWAYVVLVGMPTSVIRAATMLTIYSVCTLDDRDKMSMNALFVTVAIMLSCSPMMIWDVGFQLSVLSVLSIFVFYSPLYRLIPMKFLFAHPFIRKMWSMVMVSTAAQIGTAPLSAYCFGRFSCYFLFSNIIAIPLVTLMLYFVVASLVLWIIPILRHLCILVVKAIASFLGGFLLEMSGWDGVSIENISINWIQLMLIYAMIAVLTVMLSKIYSILK